MLAEKRRSKGRWVALGLILVSIIVIGIVLSSSKTNKVNSLIKESLYYLKLGDYDRALDKLDQAAISDGITDDQKQIVDSLREIIVYIKKDPSKKDIFTNRIEEITKKVEKDIKEKDKPKEIKEVEVVEKKSKEPKFDTKDLRLEDTTVKKEDLKKIEELRKKEEELKKLEEERKKEL